jgi:hypothetical protein
MALDNPPKAADALALWFEGARAWNELVNAQRPVPHDLTREVAVRALVFVTAYYQPDNWVNDAPIVSFPVQLSKDIARNLQLIAMGHIPNWILALQKQGAPRVDPKVAEWIGLGLAYRDACEKGFIQDKAHTKTVAELYGVSRTAIQGWAKKYPSDFRLFFTFARSDEERAELIRADLPRAAHEYVNWGRGPANPRPFGKATRRRRAKG